MKAYHFHNGRTLRDGRPLPPLGQKLVHEWPLVLCESGLHFSRHPFDALLYAPGPFLDIVHVGGIVIEPQNENKGVCSERTRIKTIDATPLLRKAARWFALEVVHLWPATDEAKEFLLTGKESLRAATWAAAYAAGDAAGDAARAAGAAWAARATAWAAGDAGAVWAARAARATAWDAAYTAAGADIKNKQRQQFLSLVEAAFAEADPRAGAMDY